MLRNLSRTSPLSVEVGALTAPFARAGGGNYTIAPRSSVAATIFLSPTGSGTATQLLQISSGDPTHSNVAVQVTATIRGGKLSIPQALSLSTAMSSVASKTVMLRNSGMGTLSGIVQAFSPNAPFTLLGGPVAFWLGPHQSQPLTIQFRPASVGTVHENLLISTTEPAGTATLSVSGSAK
jgi:hypothetical protein